MPASFRYIHFFSICNIPRRHLAFIVEDAAYKKIFGLHDLF